MSALTPSDHAVQHSLQERMRMVARRTLGWALRFGAVSALAGSVLGMVMNGAGVPIRYLSGTPFDSFVVPGLILGVVVGGTQALGALAMAREWRWRAIFAAIAGFGMIVWIFTELALISEYSVLQSVYFALGVAELVLVIALLQPKGGRRTARPIERVTSADLISLSSDPRATAAQLGAVLILDLDGDDHAAVDLFVADFGRRMRAVPRLRQRLMKVAPGLGRPVWVDDATFDLRDHVTVRVCPPGGRIALLDLATTALTAPLPQDRALWSAVLVTHVASSTCALVLVLHHVVGDGLSALSLLSSLSGDHELVDDVELPEPVPTVSELRRDARETRLRSLRDSPRVTALLVHGLLHLIWNRQPSATRSSLNQPTGPRRRVITMSRPLQEVRAAAHREGATIDDVLLVAVAGALGRLMAGRGEPLADVTISVPVSSKFRPQPSGLGNHSGVFLVRIATTGRPVARLREASARTSAAKHTPDASASVLEPVSAGLKKLGLFEYFIDHQRTITTLISDVAGPVDRVRICGAEVTEIVPLSVTTGNVTVSFFALSYAGTLTVSVMVDPEACPDLGELIQHLELETDELLQVAYAA